MTWKSWEDSDLARASARLDTELVEIFSEIEKISATATAPSPAPAVERPAERPAAGDELEPGEMGRPLAGVQQYDEMGLPEAEILEEEIEEKARFRPPRPAAARVADLSPEELADLVERAAARGVAEALKKRF